MANSKKTKVAIGCVLGLALLFVPEPTFEPEAASGEPFSWGQGEAPFAYLERAWVEARDRGCEASLVSLTEKFAQTRETLAMLERRVGIEPVAVPEPETGPITTNTPGDAAPAAPEPDVANTSAIANTNTSANTNTNTNANAPAEAGSDAEVAAAIVPIVAPVVPPPPSPSDPILQTLEDRLFALGAELGACPDRVSEYVSLVARMRTAVKRASRGWDLSDRQARGRLYRSLYGGRGALEQNLLQMPPGEMPTVVRGVDEPSAAPSKEIMGITVHSGDILVSRGGAPTSAFIARGNDYPGNFSHIALVHISEDGEFKTIEAHIEIGVVVEGLEKYMADPKLRVMLLRMRSDHEAMIANPRLAHDAAEHALAAASAEHITYDFAMDFRDHTTQFCSEVASSAYQSQGVALWEGLTSMSAQGTARWLSRLGVREFETHGPSDIEYDPKLVVVAEWRDAETLLQDQIDGVIIEALLEEAEAGGEFGYAFWKLPIARAIKGYSMLKNLFGKPGPIPEGMSATVGLRVEWLRQRHTAIKQKMTESIEGFREERGYAPPIWELRQMARQARVSLFPA